MSGPSRIGEIRAEAYAHFDGTKGFDNEGRRNAYVCDHMADGSNGCGSFIVTVDREPGVTPALLKCPQCGNFAGSKFYRIADWLEPTHEWYRPETLDGLTDGERDHVERGGLLLRQIGGGKADGGWQKGDRIKTLHAQHRFDQRAEVRQMIKPPLDRAAYPNRQQYRAAVREQRKGRA